MTSINPKAGPHQTSISAKSTGQISISPLGVGSLASRPAASPDAHTMALRPSAGFSHLGSDLVKRMADEPAPIDREMVVAIKTAIAEGRYPIDPDRIASALMMLKASTEQ